MPLGHPPACPWDPRLVLEEQQDKKKQDKKKIRDNGSALKKQQERSEFLLRAVPVSMEATVGVNVAEDEKGELANCLGFDFLLLDISKFDGSHLAYFLLEQEP